jgi:hypothetical protein
MLWCRSRDRTKDSSDAKRRAGPAGRRFLAARAKAGSGGLLRMAGAAGRAGSRLRDWLQPFSSRRRPSAAAATATAFRQAEGGSHEGRPFSYLSAACDGGVLAEPRQQGLGARHGCPAPAVTTAPLGTPLSNLVRPCSFIPSHHHPLFPPAMLVPLTALALATATSALAAITELDSSLHRCVVFSLRLRGCHTPSFQIMPSSSPTASEALCCVSAHMADRKRPASLLQLFLRPCIRR